MRIIKYTFLSVCIVSAIIATAMSPLFNIKQINIQGNNKITNEEIISLSQIKIDENTYKTNIHKAQHKILENPYINDVKIKRKIPDKIVIIIEERKPTYMLEYGSGYVYISNQGEQKVANLGNGVDLSTKILNIKSILEKEKGVSGEIFVDMDLKTNNPIFRQNV